MKRISYYIIIATLFLVAFASCKRIELGENENPRHKAGEIGVSEITVDGAVAKKTSSRAVDETGDKHTSGDEAFVSGIKPNTAFTALESGDKLWVCYNFEGVTDFSLPAAMKYKAYAKFNGNSWSFEKAGENPFALKPNEIGASGESWGKARMALYLTGTVNNLTDKDTYDGDMIYASATTAGVFTGSEPMLNDQAAIPGVDGIVREWLYYDALTAETSADGTGETDVDGSVKKGCVAIDRTLSSLMLGEVRVSLAHAGALLRLAPSDIKIEGMKDVGMKYLWARVKRASKEYYVPLTAVTVGGIQYRQAIVPAGATIEGFVVVTGIASDNSKDISVPTTLAVPKLLSRNLRYSLKMEISLATAEINFIGHNGVLGWGTEEEEPEIVDPARHLAVSRFTDEKTTLSYKVLTGFGLELLNSWMTGPDGVPELLDGTTILTRAERMATNITLTRDVALRQPAAGKSNWKPIGTPYYPYTGIFDGAGYSIEGLTINHTGNNICAGLIGQNIGAIKNITLLDANITVDGTDCHAGAFAGINSGQSGRSGAVVNCHLKGNSNIKASSYVGGITGWNLGYTLACSNNSSGNLEGSYAGGIVGFNAPEEGFGNGIIGSWSTATVNGTTSQGGINGNNGGAVNECNTTQSVGSGKGSQVDDIAALNNSSKITAMNSALTAYNVQLALSEVTIKCPFVWKAGDAPTTVGPTTQFVKKPDLEYNETTGTYIVRTANSLLRINHWLSGKVRTAPVADDGKYCDWYYTNSVNITLDADIDMVGISDWGQIGARDDDPYNGTFDGRGYTISNLTIKNINKNMIGLFGIIGERLYKSGTVKNLIIKGATIQANGNYVGIVAGKVHSAGTIENVVVVGSNIILGSSPNGKYIGGIAGWVKGGKIDNCHVVGGKIASSGTQVGGITGLMEGASSDIRYSEIATCSNSATVEGYSYVGGVVGEQFGDYVYGCWNTGKVSYSDQSSKGYIGSVTGQGGTRYNCYPTNDASDGQYAGESHFQFVNAAINAGTITSTQGNWKWVAGKNSNSRPYTVKK